MLALARRSERAQIRDGQTTSSNSGCGWGSLSASIWRSSPFPGSADHRRVEFPARRKEYIGRRGEETAARGRTQPARSSPAGHECTFLELAEPGAFDRAVSIEMFEHMKNYSAPSSARDRPARLKPDGLLFVHIFTHCPLPLSLRGEGCDRLDGAVFLHRGPDALPRSPRPLPGRPDAGQGLADQRPPLPAHGGGLAPEHGPAPGGDPHAFRRQA